MNWFTRGVLAGDAAYKQKQFDQDGGCEHAEKDINLAQVVRREMDSFGPVSSYVCCKACDDKAAEEEDNQEVGCQDCKMVVKKKDTISWRWYDFYAAQGDEAVVICNACRVLPKHLDRVARDDQDRRAEFGDEPEQDDGDYPGPGDDDFDNDTRWHCHCCRGYISAADEGRQHDDYSGLICTPCHTKRA